MKGIRKIVKCFEDSGLLIKDVQETIEKKKNQKRGPLWMSLGTLGARMTHM